MTTSIIFTILLLLFFLAVRMPVGFALGIAGSIGLYLIGGLDLVNGVLLTTPYSSAASFVFTTYPMFCLMAEFSSNSGMTSDIFNAANRLFGHVKGGLAIACVFANAGLAAVSGSSIASAAAISKTTIPEMRKYGYDDRLSAGIVAVAGTLAILIPPSVVLIIYGILTEVSIGALLIAGVLPGIVTAVGYIVSISIWVRKDPKIAPDIPPFSSKERIESLKKIWPMLILILSVVVGIYSGLVTPTEAGALGASVSFLLALYMTKKCDWLEESLTRTATTSAMLFTIVIGAMVFGYFLTNTQLTLKLVSIVKALDVNRWIIYSLIIFIYLFLGMFLDQFAVLFLTVPLTFPIMMALGFDPVWYGIIVTKTVAIGQISPPVGINVYTVAHTADIPIEKTFQGVWPLLASELVVLFLLSVFPAISTWLPNMMNL